MQGEWPCGHYPVLVDLPGIHPSQAHAGDLAHALRPSQAPRLEPLHEEELPKGPNSHILVAQRQVQVAEEALQDFHHALCCYVDFTGAQSHCLHVSAQKTLDNASFTLYEFWQDEASWRRHQQSACSKAFQRILIDHLRAPDTLTTVFFPASWWIMNNN